MSLDHPELIGTLLVIGGLSTLLLRHLMAWQLDDGRSHLPWVLTSATGIAFGIVRILHLSSVDPAHALIFIRLQYVIALFLPALGVATLETLNELTHTRSTYALLAMPFVLVVVGLATSAFVGGTAIPRVDALGHRFYAAQPHPGLLILVVPVAWLSVLVFRRVRALPGTLPKSRRGIRIALIVFAALGVNDIAIGAGAIRSLHAFEYGYLVFAIVASRFEAHRTIELRDQLSDLVDNKQRALAAHQRSLETTLTELTDSRARYRHLADATREGVLRCAGDRIVDANAALGELLGTDGATLAGQPLLALFAAADRATVTAATPATPIEVRCLHRDGHELVVSLVISDNDAAGGRVLLLRDLSQEQALHRRLVRADRLAAIGTLAAGTAHEINNPLTYVIANTELLGDELATLAGALPPGATDPARALLVDLHAGTARIRRVVEQLTVLSQDRTSDEGPVDVRAAVELAVAMAANQLRDRARLVLELQATPRVFGSDHRLGQVFLNLLVNAAQAIPEGEAERHLVRVVTRHDRDQVIVEISDTGVGMPPEVRDRVFDPFFTTKAVGHGTGLGLAISRGIVTRAGGRIEFTSVPGVGTTFRVELPTLPADLPDQPAPGPVLDLPTTPRSILVVDDEVLVARTIARMLSPHRVDIASGGREALARCAAHHYDVVVCDLMMPDMNGMEFHRALVEQGDDVHRRFVFATGGVFTEAARAFLEDSERRWIPKPFTRAEIRHAVDALIDSQLGATPAAGPGSAADRSP